MSALLHQVLIDKGGHHIHNLFASTIWYGIDRLRCFERAATSEYGEPPEEPPLLGIQQAIAPGNRVAQRLLPGGRILRPARQHGQASTQSREEDVWWEEVDAHRRQLDSER
ncbi:MAG: hypothetical protein E6I32_04020 [Chloroflexi bacterium]|nr:MAG: hypothetical protein E6I32_04020 [Chloroflexota bacterium]